MRRTKAVAIYATTKDIEVVRNLLGQSSLSSTQSYLGVDTAQALALSRQFDFFDLGALEKYGLGEIASEKFDHFNQNG